MDNNWDLKNRCIFIRNIMSGFTKEYLSEDNVKYIASICTLDKKQLEMAMNHLLADISLFQPETIDEKFINESIDKYIDKNYLKDGVINGQKN